MSLGLAIVGTGKMGRMCEELAAEYGFEVRAQFDGANNADGVGLTREALRGVDAAVEFSEPGAAVGIFERWRRRESARRWGRRDGARNWRRLARR